jgi:Glycosyltransferase Family 4
MKLGCYNPLRLPSNVNMLAQLIAAERVDIVHAHHAAAAWSAWRATHKQPVYLVTSATGCLRTPLAGHAAPPLAGARV